MAVPKDGWYRLSDNVLKGCPQGANVARKKQSLIYDIEHRISRIPVRESSNIIHPTKIFLTPLRILAILKSTPETQREAICLWWIYLLMENKI